MFVPGEILKKLEKGILSINDKSIREWNDVQEVMKGEKKGTRVNVTVKRNGKIIELRKRWLGFIKKSFLDI